MIQAQQELQLKLFLGLVFLEEIKADFVSDGRNDDILEEFVIMLRLNIKVSAVRWEFISEDAE